MRDYTVDDLVVSEVEYDYRMKVSTPSLWKYSKAKAACFTTKDGKYTTGVPDSDGYS